MVVIIIENTYILILKVFEISWRWSVCSSSLHLLVFLPLLWFDVCHLLPSWSFCSSACQTTIHSSPIWSASLFISLINWPSCWSRSRRITDLSYRYRLRAAAILRPICRIKWNLYHTLNNGRITIGWGSNFGESYRNFAGSCLLS